MLSSVVEILYAVYDYMRHDPKNPKWEERDIFILSKGHAALALYSVLAEFGYFPVEDVYSFGVTRTDSEFRGLKLLPALWGMASVLPLVWHWE